jgi:hypothetical protein
MSYCFFPVRRYNKDIGVKTMERDIMDIIKEHDENHDPDEPIENVGYCEYCYQVFPLEQLVEKEIWINGSRRKMLFCSEKHAAYCQMGAEG